jgi:hypothetical protein
MSDLRVGTMQGRKQDNIVFGDKLDADKELIVTFEDVGLDVGSEDRYLSVPEIIALRDHLTWVLTNFVDKAGVS